MIPYRRGLPRSTGISPEPDHGYGKGLIMKDQHLVQSVGEALYGQEWTANLARELHVSDRSMRRWANGTDPIQWGVFFDLARIVERRLKSLRELHEQLYQRTLVAVSAESNSKPYDRATKWYIEVHDPESGRHSCLHFDVFGTLAEVKSEMKRHPGMIFSITMPDRVSDAERADFQSMNIRRL
jgi:hypothetical protein